MSRSTFEPEHGDLFWAALAPTTGREQDGHRPVLVVASPGYLRTVTSLVLVVPLTTTDRGWPNHVPVRGTHTLGTDSWAMTEQVRTIARSRLTRYAGRADLRTTAAVGVWLGDFLALG